MTIYKDFGTRPTTPRVSRRRLLQSTAALGAASAIPASLLGGHARAATPKRGGHFRVGIGGGSTSDSLDPATYENSFMQGIGGALHNMLTEVGPDGSLEPALATEWEASPDAVTWTFKLRKDVVFHSGKTLTAEDVIASLNHHRGEDSKSAAKVTVDPIKAMKALDPHTVEVELESGNADLPFLVSDYHLVIMPSKDGAVDANSGIGTGPFRVESYDPGIRCGLTRNPDYFREGRPYFDSIDFLVLADKAARTNALLTGEIDYMDRCDLKTVHLLKRRAGVVVEETTGMQHYTIPMNMTVAPFSDNNVRMALKHAIDREAIVQTILRGYGSVGNDNPIAPTNRYFNADIPQRVYDPDKARYYVKQSGLGTLAVELSAADAAFAGCVDTAVLYREHAARAGIDITVRREPDDGYWANIWMKKPWSFSYWGGRPVEDQMFSVAYLTGAAWNESFQSIERFDELLVAARAELDEDRRREMYAEMQLIVHNEGGAVIPMFANYVNAYSDKVAHGPVVGGNIDLDGLRIAERWWFA